MRYIKTIDDITKDGSVDFGAGYEFVEDAKDADAILMRSTDLHGYELPEGCLLYTSVTCPRCHSKMETKS